VFLLRFTDPDSLARRVVDDASVNVFDLMVNHLEDLAAAMGIGYMRVLGDEIVCAAGMGDSERDHCRLVADLALKAQDRCIEMFESLNLPMAFRIGIDTGTVMGSSLGKVHQAYNIWGDAVRFASMMAKTGIPGAIQVSEGTYRCLRSGYLFKARGKFYLPEIGEVSTYLLTG
jgi:adenylate cyclase